MNESSERWAAIPPVSTPRWLIPRRPAIAPAGLRVYQPVTLRGRLAWEGARLLARTGAFYLLPSRSDYPLLRHVRPFIPAGWHVAMAHSAIRTRGVALAIDSGGDPALVIKVASDDLGSRRLWQEGDNIQRFAPLLPPPISAPTIIDRADGVLVLSAVNWVPRWRPWQLPVALAEATGRFHAEASAGRPAHGDFAPWNVLESRDGWVLIDWEEATPSAPPGLDLFHYLVQAHVLLGRPRASDIVSGTRGGGPLSRTFSAYLGSAGLTGMDVEAGLAAYLLRSMTSQDGSRAEHRKALISRRALLSMLQRTRS